MDSKNFECGTCGGNVDNRGECAAHPDGKIRPRGRVSRPFSLLRDSADATYNRSADRHFARIDS